MKRIAITGANGIIGKVLRKGLGGYKITVLDLPDIDIRNYEQLLAALEGHDLIIHLAWDMNPKDEFEGSLDNNLMTLNILKAAVETKIPRIIMASSVHVDTFSDWKGPKLLTVDKRPCPNCFYGVSKYYMEILGKFFSDKKGSEVVCIRFGRVRKENTPPITSNETKVWLSHRDCVDAVKTYIDAEKILDNYVVFYAISNNTGRIHDYSNPLGWVPKDNISNFL